ncbi:hypothetical protein B7764_22105 (plasmid) [Pantoea ananatis]|nr:hypothetical protein B7764_22070 [Pantoea ananatis]ASN17867.1 hypothetical protein B7764_22105 [Pantoea ananatis]
MSVDFCDARQGGGAYGKTPATRPFYGSWPFAGLFLRLDDLAEFYRQCKSVGIQETSSGYPRIHAPELQEWGGTMAALVDRGSIPGWAKNSSMRSPRWRIIQPASRKTIPKPNLS